MLTYTHHVISIDNKPINFKALFHPDDKYWFHVSVCGKYNCLIDKNRIIDKDWTILGRHHDSDYWFDAITYKPPRCTEQYYESMED